MKANALLDTLNAVERFVNADPSHPEDATHKVTVSQFGGMTRARVYNYPTKRELMRAEWFSDATPDEAIIIARAVLMSCGYYHVEFCKDGNGMLQVKPVFNAEGGAA